MKHLNKVALSASVMVIAAQAMSVSANAVEAPIAVPHIDDASQVTGRDVFSRLEVISATSAALPDLVTRYELNGETLQERYRLAQSDDFVKGNGIANPSRNPNVAGCHSACHQDSGGYC